MEFKRRLLKKNKSRQAKLRKQAGFGRVKVRGRKRWIKVAEVAAEEK
ncbi:MAG: hypothetical protein ACYTFY_01765 [Planctomycetota bacterium]